MTTIKLIPSVMEFDVSLDSASMPSLFSQSLETTIIEQVERQVAGRIPTTQDIVGQVADAVTDDRDFSRKIRDWVLESIDYYDIKRNVLDDMDYADIAESLINDDSVNENLQRAILNNARFRTMIGGQVSTYMDSMDINSMVTNTINELAVNLSNTIAEQVLTMITSRLSLASDV
jgi:hypothetical protein